MSTPTAQHSIFRTAEGAELLHSEYRELLALWPVANRQHCVSTAQGDTFVVESGTPGKPVLVLLHGSMSVSAMWMQESRVLAKDYHLYAIDIIGEAGLSAPSRPLLGSDAYARWLDEVLDALLDLLRDGLLERVLQRVGHVEVQASVVERDDDRLVVLQRGDRQALALLSDDFHCSLGCRTFSACSRCGHRPLPAPS